MKKLLAVIGVLICLVMIFASLVTAAEVNKDIKAESKVVVKFKDKAQLKEFQDIFLEQQRALERINVLQGYISLDSGYLQELDKKMKEKFKFTFDRYKLYDIDMDEMEITELGFMPQQYNVRGNFIQDDQGK